VCLAKADSEDGRRALADLCDAYYEPVVAYLRSVFGDPDAAREMSHAFFAEMLGGGTIHTADQERGRFRSYLLGAVKHFVGHQREAARRMKRGGGLVAVSLDDEEAVEVPDVRVLSPDAEFDRQWAMTVIARSMEMLR
jgi:RNA polymerase sigma-70 factor (ECF subfamily)